jgi:hypothetical protein
MTKTYAGVAAMGLLPASALHGPLSPVFNTRPAANGRNRRPGPFLVHSAMRSKATNPSAPVAGGQGM